MDELLGDGVVSKEDIAARCCERQMLTFLIR